MKRKEIQSSAILSRFRKSRWVGADPEIPGCLNADLVMRLHSYQSVAGEAEFTGQLVPSRGTRGQGGLIPLLDLTIRDGVPIENAPAAYSAKSRRFPARNGE
jgi:hypothetical protein